MRPRREFHTVTSVRGLASLAVCLFHMALWAHLMPQGWLRTIFSGGWLGPHVFFIVSGFVVPWSLHVVGYRWRMFPAYLARRLVRLDPPYIATIALVIVLEWLGAMLGVPGADGLRFEWARLLSHVAYLTEFLGQEWYNPVFWTLAIEFQFYLLLALVFPFIAHRQGAVRWLTYALGLAAFLPTMGQNQTLLLSGYLPLFMLGFVLFQWHAGIIGRLELGLLSTPLIVLAKTYTPLLAPLALLAFLLMLRDRWRCRFTEFLGRISYSLYLIHMPVGIAFQRLAKPYADSDMEKFLAVWLSLALCLIAAWVFYVVVERPAIAWARKIPMKSGAAHSA